MSEPTRTYSNEEVVIEWRAELCVHCRACIEGLAAVFDLAGRPWVNINGAPPSEIREQVAKCPSGALSIKEPPHA